VPIGICERHDDRVTCPKFAYAMANCLDSTSGGSGTWTTRTSPAAHITVANINFLSTMRAKKECIRCIHGAEGTIRLVADGPVRHAEEIDLRENMNEILDFLSVARERSFTRAAASLGVSQSALSHSVRSLESRLGVRLLSRTTRSVSVTEAGERLVQSVGPRLEDIAADISAVTDMGDKVSGTVRITAIDHVVDAVIWPRLSPVLNQYPGLRIEISSDYRMVDIAAERFDIGIRWGDQLQKDMIAMRLTPDVPMTIVATPGYFQSHGVPADPKDLMTHNCITLRLLSIVWKPA